MIALHADELIERTKNELKSLIASGIGTDTELAKRDEALRLMHKRIVALEKNSLASNG
jgi:hypothetical protein